MRADLGTAAETIDAKDHKGRTALFGLVRKRQNQAARFLIEQGADPLAEDRAGTSVLALAVMGCNGEQGVGTLAFIDAALAHLKTTGRVDDLRRVLDGHIASNSPSVSLFRAAIMSVVKKDTGAIGLLDITLSHGADPQVVFPQQMTALHLAIHASDPTAVALLLKHGANPNAPKHDGATPLHLAILRSMPSIVTLLLAHGADTSLCFGEASVTDLPFWRNKNAADLAFIEGHKLMAGAIREWDTLWKPTTGAA
jgi:ankyrin repeat protein